MTLFRVVTIVLTTFGRKKNILFFVKKSCHSCLKSKVGWIQCILYSTDIPENLGNFFYWFLSEIGYHQLAELQYPPATSRCGGYYHTTSSTIGLMMACNDKASSSQNSQNWTTKDSFWNRMKLGFSISSSLFWSMVPYNTIEIIFRSSYDRAMWVS